MEDDPNLGIEKLEKYIFFKEQMKDNVTMRTEKLKLNKPYLKDHCTFQYRTHR